MRSFGKWSGRVILALVLVGVVIWQWGPREVVVMDFSFDEARFGSDIDAYLADEEGKFTDLTPGVQKRVIWAGAPGQQTDIAVVYVHGWSATSQEIRPVPDNVAKALGANLYFARLTGHGRPGTALAEASVGDWTRDMAEAAAIGRRIGKRVILMGTSTGATLISTFAADPARLQDVAGLVLIAPNYRIKAAGSSLLTLPFARYYLPFIMGKTRSWTGMNEGHNTYWTREYPVEALLPLAAIVKETEAMDFAEIALPALFVYAPIDPTVDHSRTEEVIADWGGPVETQVFDIPAAEADTAHVITGDIVSPMRTAPVTARIIDWAEGLAQ